MAELRSSDVLAKQLKKDKDIEDRLTSLEEIDAEDRLTSLEEIDAEDRLTSLEAQVPTTSTISLNGNWSAGSQQTAGSYTVGTNYNITSKINWAVSNSKNIIISFIIGEGDNIESCIMCGYSKGFSAYGSPCYHVYFNRNSSIIDIHCWTASPTLLVSSGAWDAKFNKGKFVITQIN